MQQRFVVAILEIATSEFHYLADLLLNLGGIDDA
jgi:hypothetical protein